MRHLLQTTQVRRRQSWLGFALLALLTPVVGCSNGDTEKSKEGTAESKEATATADGQPPLLLSLDGNEVSPLADKKAAAKVLIFVRSDCPISNRYSPELQRLHQLYSGKGVTTFLIYVDPKEPVETIRKHLQEYQIPGTPLRDPEHKMVAFTGVTITPEVAVYNDDNTLVYRGRIDNRYVDFGKALPEATEHDLEQVLRALVNGEQVALRNTTAIGCYIGDLAPNKSPQPSEDSEG